MQIFLRRNTPEGGRWDDTIASLYEEINRIGTKL